MNPPTDMTPDANRNAIEERPARLLRLMRETARLFFRLRVVADEVHHQGELTAARRSFLRELHRKGPRTVPQMARARPVSRQHFQVLANGLADEGLVEFVDNPAHKRSPLVGLTDRGEALVTRMNRRELEVLSKLSLELSDGDIETTARTLCILRKHFESTDWQGLIESAERQG